MLLSYVDTYYDLAYYVVMYCDFSLILLVKQKHKYVFVDICRHRFIKYFYWCKQVTLLYMFYTVHCSIIINENQQNAQMIYFFRFTLCSTSGRVGTAPYSTTTQCTHQYTGHFKHLYTTI